MASYISNPYYSPPSPKQKAQATSLGTRFAPMMNGLGVAGGAWAAKQAYDLLMAKAAEGALTAAEQQTLAQGMAAAMDVTPGAMASGNALASAGVDAAATGATGAAESGAITAGTEGATAGVEGAAGSGMGAAGSTASILGGAAGLGLGSYGVYNATQMKDKGQAALAGGLSGAGAGMGAGMLALGAANMWNPVGWGLIGGGALLGAGLGGILAHKTTKEIEAERWKDSGRTPGFDPSKGVDYFEGTPGVESRDEKYLTSDNILKYGTPDNYTDNPYFDTWTAEQRKAWVDSLLAKGLVTEKAGGIYYDDEKARAEAEEMNKTFSTQTPANDAANQKRWREQDAGNQKRWREQAEAKARADLEKEKIKQAIAQQKDPSQYQGESVMAAPPIVTSNPFLRR